MWSVSRASHSSSGDLGLDEALQVDCEGAYYLLGRALFANGRYQEVVDMADAAIAAAGEDYDIYVPVINALGALGKKDGVHKSSSRGSSSSSPT